MYNGGLDYRGERLRYDLLLECASGRRGSHSGLRKRVGRAGDIHLHTLASYDS